MSDLHYWLALNLLPDVGPVIAKRLLSMYGSPENIFHLSLNELRSIEGVGENRAKKIATFNKWDIVSREIEKADKFNVHIISMNDQRYPVGLRQIIDAPVVIYVKGRMENNDKFAIAMVGSRNSTDYGITVAEKISHDLASSGLSIVSGMAKGIDTASHKGAIKAGGRTIAVLGSGIDMPYPYSNRGLMEAIESQGTVISEFPFGTRPNKENFPRRNRIISALSMGVIVVEATLDSGSLITVGYALEQGKEVFAVPGSVNSKNAKGTNELIKNGARLIETAGDVIEELRYQLTGILREEKQSVPDIDMSADEKTLYDLLSSEPKHIDTITRELNITSGKALSVLLNLELKGVVGQAVGKHFYLHL